MRQPERPTIRTENAGTRWDRASRILGKGATSVALGAAALLPVAAAVYDNIACVAIDKAVESQEAEGGDTVGYVVGILEDENEKIVPDTAKMDEILLNSSNVVDTEALTDNARAYVVDAEGAAEVRDWLVRIAALLVVGVVGKLCEERKCRSKREM